jgi:hypothetical protein
LNQQLQAVTFICQERNLLGKSKHLSPELIFIDLRQLIDETLILLQLPEGRSKFPFQTTKIVRIRIWRGLVRHRICH